MHTLCKYFYSFIKIKNIYYFFYNFYSSELKNFKEKCLIILQRFYESKGHQKKQIQGGG